MRLCRSLVLAALTLSACAGGRPDASLSSRPGDAAQGPTAFDVDSAVRRMATLPLWPGFDPLAIPLAVYDGRNTALFRHPEPPAGYHSLSRAPGLWLRQGRDLAVTANSSATLGGVTTATMMLDLPERRTATQLGALAIHELFHVYQRQSHPAWTANEADLFTYPVEEVGALALRREESFALQEAMTSADADEAACWAEYFAQVRMSRFARLGTAASAYERGTELTEGLAQYVETRARGGAASLATHEYPASAVRARAYDVGAGMATVLDQLAPAWRDSLGRGTEGRSLDGLLAAVAAARRTPSSPRCSAPATRRTAWAAEAQAAVDSLGRERAAERAAFLGRDGWTLVVDAGAAPLMPARFDPLNVARLTSTEVLHTRHLQLGGGGATIEILGRAGLTEGMAGGHPLFNGVRRLTVTGLPVAPSLTDSAGAIVIVADGVRATLPGARSTIEGRVVRVGMP